MNSRVVRAVSSRPVTSTSRSASGQSRSRLISAAGVCRRSAIISSTAAPKATGSRAQASRSPDGSDPPSATQASSRWSVIADQALVSAYQVNAVTGTPSGARAASATRSANGVEAILTGTSCRARSSTPGSTRAWNSFIPSTAISWSCSWPWPRTSRSTGCASARASWSDSARLGRASRRPSTGAISGSSRQSSSRLVGPVRSTASRKDRHIGPASSR